jgi:uncharacterized membrane protein
MEDAMELKVARCTNLLLASLLTGNEAGTLVALHAALSTLPAPTQIAAEQAVTRRYGSIMPAFMLAVIASCFPVIGVSRVGEQRRWARAGLSCYLGMLGVTLVGNIPLNRQTLRASPQLPEREWQELRSSWNRLHAVRVLLDVAGLACLYLSTVQAEK